uniref:Mannosyltransferase n=2 Tax=Parascaris univalens TaxID=6257 RepID=A0A915BD27_PARUN
MTKKNLSLLKRSSNRSASKPSAQGHEENIEQNNDSDIQVDRYAKLYVPSGDFDVEWQPASGSVFKILFSLRISAAMWSSISDCDEVYNYWEPLHLFVYGNGFQTWEYSPLYAIRSYAYILLHYGPALVLRTLFSSNKVGVFMTMRCMLGLLNVLSEMALYKALGARLGNGIARLYIAFSILSSGMFISSCAFLPSSFSMSLNTFALAAYIDNNWFLSILFTAISALVGWPFAAVLGLPVMLEMMVVRPKRLLVLFLNYAIMCGGATIIALVLIDSYYYGRTVLAPLNIVLYNVFSSHGPNLYGVEDVTFYMKNLFLNWNVAIVLVPFAVPFAAFVFVRVRSSKTQSHRMPFEFSFAYWQRFLPVLFVFFSFAAWLLIFFTQPHKEERFLFPIYPLIALLAAVAFDAIPRVGSALFGGGTRKFWNFTVGALLAVFVLLSLSRSAALHRNFAAPIDVFKGLNEHLTIPATLDKERYRSRENSSSIHVCVGKEWYRFPSSFFLPSGVVDRRGRKWDAKLNFIKSEFSGLLPKPFADGPLPNITRMIPTHMNDLNREEPTRYVSVDICDYLVDLETPDVTELEPDFAAQRDVWQSVVRRRFLLSSYSEPLLRSFYVPFLTNDKIRFGTYHLLERI